MDRRRRSGAGRLDVNSGFVGTLRCCGDLADCEVWVLW